MEVHSTVPVIQWPIRLRARKVSIHEIINFICEKENIPHSLLISPQRKMEYVRPRNIARYLCCQLTSKSLPTIGYVFRNDHTSILSAREKIAAERKINKKLDEKIRNYELELTSPCNTAST